MRPRPCGPGYAGGVLRRGAGLHASMRPRPCGPGYVWCYGLGVWRCHGASMRPRPCGPGYYCTPVHIDMDVDRFNEAQAMRPGIRVSGSGELPVEEGFNEAQAMRPGIPSPGKSDVKRK